MFNTDSIELPESLASFVQNGAVSIDCGITMSRIIFVVNNDGDRKSIRYFCIENNKLKETLENILEIVKGDLLNKGFVTGFKKLWAKSVVESVFDMDIILVGESLALSNGFELVSDCLSMDDIEYKTGDMSFIADRYKIDDNNPLINQIRKATHFEADIDTEINENKINLPAILIMVGSCTRYFLAKRDKSLQPLNTMVYGRAALKGLSKCLVNVNNHSNIVEMANTGNREHVDTQAWEMFSDDEKSPYGKLPHHFPMFAFGKGADYDIMQTFSENDLMESLCNFVSNNCVSLATKLCKMYKTKTVYLCGSVFQAPVFGRLLFFQSDKHVRNFDIKTIKCDYMLALGTLKI